MLNRMRKWLGGAGTVLAAAVLFCSMGTVKAAEGPARVSIKITPDDHIINGITLDGKALVPQVGKEPGKLERLEDESQVRIVQENWQKEDIFYKYELVLESVGNGVFWFEYGGEDSGYAFAGEFNWENIQWVDKLVNVSIGTNGAYNRLTFRGRVENPDLQATYAVQEGENSQVTLGNGQGLRVKIDADHKYLEGVYLDGQRLEDKDYTVEQGSTIINVQAAALEKAGAGAHTLEVAFYIIGGIKKVPVAYQAQKSPAPAADKPKQEGEAGKVVAPAADKPAAPANKTEAGKAATPAADKPAAPADKPTTGGDKPATTSGSQKEENKAAPEKATTGQSITEKTPAETTGGNTQGNQVAKTTKGKQVAVAGTKAPKTGDRSMAVWVLAAMAFLGAGLATCTSRKER